MTDDRKHDLIRSERDRYVAFAFAAADLLLEADSSGIVRFAGGAAQSLLGVEAEALVGRPFLDLLVPADRPLVRSSLAVLARRGRLAPLPIRLSGGESRAAVLRGFCFPGDAKILRLTLTLPTPSVPRPASADARDTETGLRDPADFSRLASARLEENPDLSVTFIDVDGLGSLRKEVDGELVTGLMTLLGRQMQAKSAGGDAAGRLGEARFGVLHDEPIDPAALAEQIGDLAMSVGSGSAALNIQSATLKGTDLSVGGRDAVRLLTYAVNRFADSRNEISIGALRNGLRPILDAAVGQLRGLRSDIAAKSFELAYQPIVRLESREAHHFEALVRFRKDVSPMERIIFAEQTGLIEDLDLAIVEAAVASLIALGGSAAPVDVAVNASGRSLQSERFRVALERMLVPQLSSRLMLEITESAVIDDRQVVARFLESVRRSGFRVCIDDFGAGAASFDYLNAFTVDFIKIDGKYARACTTNQRDRALIKAITTLAQRLGCSVIAEQIETEEQAAALRELGVQFGQGYLFARPGPLPTVFKGVRRWQHDANAT